MLDFMNSTLDLTNAMPASISATGISTPLLHNYL
jgi:hypothetical protein